MNTRVVILFCSLFLAAPLYGREKTDVIVMKNGDHWTCEIKKLDAGALYAGLDYIDGTISVEWSKVARVESRQLFLVQTQSGAIYTGSLKTPETPADEPVKIEVEQAPAKEVVLPRSRVVELRQTSETFWRRVSGNINGGLTYSKGNNATQYNIGSLVNYRRARWSAQVDFSSNLSSSEGSTTSTRNQLSLKGMHYMRWDNWFYTGIGSFLQSFQQGIQLQTTAGGGIGRYVKNTSLTRISLTGGLAWQGTNYKGSGDSQGIQSIAAALIAGDLELFRFKKTNLHVTASLIPAISEAGRVRVNTNATYSI